ncbi:MAG: DUF4145 domain-containing protein [Phycisphaerales bacterium]|nr:DUF4145 domain-containing protein [Phycisphaerales bacterium]
MSQPRATFNKDHEEIVQKFARLIEQVRNAPHPKNSAEGALAYFAVKVSGLNLIARTAGERSIYYRELDAIGGNRANVYPPAMQGILTAAMTDFREGFMADAKLLVSAEVLADFLVQAEVLLDHDYKDAAAVIIRAVLEDGLRRVCLSKGIEVRDRAGVDELAQALTKQNVLTAVQKKEIDAKREIGNAAAHGRFDAFTKQDVVAFHEFVRRLLATVI